MKKRTLFSCIITACLLGWTGLLPASGGFPPQSGNPEAQDSGDENGDGNGGQDENDGQGGEDGEDGQGGGRGQDNRGDRNAPQNKGKISFPGSKGGEDEGGDDENGGEDTGEDNGGEEGGFGGRGPGNGEGQGEGRGGKARAGKKISYKDAITKAAKLTAAKQYADAGKAYNSALSSLSEDDSRKIFIYERQGWLALMSGDIQSAEGFYLAGIYQAEKIETFDKSAVNAYRGAAYCYEKDGEISSAVENYQLALKHATDKAVKADIRKKLQRLQAGKRKKTK